MKITLFEATEQLRDLFDQMDPETGSLPEGYEAARELVARKATSVAAYIIESEKQIGYLLEHAREVQARAKSATKRVEWLRRYLAEHMAAAGVAKIADDRGLFSATLQRDRDAAVEVYDELQLPSDYFRTVPASSEPDKTLIKRAIDDGYEVPGARVVRRDRLVIK